MNYYILLIASLIIPIYGYSASFDCTRAISPVEKMICKSSALSELDETLSTAYKKISKETSDTTPLSLDQRRWLQEKRAKCNDEKCLQKVYEDRILELGNWNKYAPPKHDLYGNYFIKRDNTIYEGEKKGWIAVKTEDCLSINKENNNEISFSFFLLQTNGHSCSMAGRMKRVEDHFEYVSDPNDEYDKKCKLMMKVKSNTIELIDPDGECRNTNCGARAGISGTEFLKSLKREKVCQN